MSTEAQGGMAAELERITEGLNQEQKSAVVAGDGPLLIFAGAGTGKTAVLTRRIAYLLADGSATESEICALTFTKKAAEEMKTRVGGLIGRRPSAMAIGTFHSLGLQILKRDDHAERVGLKGKFTIWGEGEASRALRRVASDMGIVMKEQRVLTEGYIKQQIEKAKDDLLRPAEFLAKAETEAERTLGEIYRRYVAEVRSANAVDFTDLIYLPCQLFLHHPDVLAKYQAEWKYLLVDEYQDTSHAQFTFVSSLAAGSRNLTVVGDDDQCLVAGTKVRMGDGRERAIEDVRVGDQVASNHGRGEMRPALVTDVFHREVRGPGIAITLGSGKKLVSTPEHTHFVSGVPAAAGRRLAAVVTMCDQTANSRPLHTITLVASGAGYDSSERTGAAYDFASEEYGDVVARLGQIRAAVDVDVQFTARLGELEPLAMLPAEALRPGMRMLNEAGGYETVASVEKVILDTLVVDLNVAGTHNFVVEGIVTHNSIYGWRNADIRNILSFREMYPEAKVVKLEQNFRSHQIILDAASAMIEKNLEREAKRLWSTKKTGDLLRVTDAADVEEEADIVASEIEKALKRGVPLTSANGKPNFAILFRINSQSRAFEEALLTRHIPHQVVGGVRFYDRDEVKAAVAYLKLLADPADETALLRAMASPQRGVGEATMTRVIQEARRTGIPALETVRSPAVVGLALKPARRGLEEFAILMDRHRELAKTATPQELLASILEQSGYRRTLRQSGKNEDVLRAENLDELVAMAGEYSAYGPSEGLTAFLENAEAVSSLREAEVQGPGVQLITAHKSKGLEFPVVFITGLEEGSFPLIREVEDEAPPKEDPIPEERRLAYVAVTRAEHRLYLTFCRWRHGKTRKSSRFLAELPISLLTRYTIPKDVKVRTDARFAAKRERGRARLL